MNAEGAFIESAGCLGEKSFPLLFFLDLPGEGGCPGGAGAELELRDGLEGKGGNGLAIDLNLTALGLMGKSGEVGDGQGCLHEGCAYLNG